LTSRLRSTWLSCGIGSRKKSHEAAELIVILSHPKISGGSRVGIQFCFGCLFGYAGQIFGCRMRTRKFANVSHFGTPGKFGCHFGRQFGRQFGCHFGSAKFLDVFLADILASNVSSRRGTHVAAVWCCDRLHLAMLLASFSITSCHASRFLLAGHGNSIMIFDTMFTCVACIVFVVVSSVCKSVRTYRCIMKLHSCNGKLLLALSSPTCFGSSDSVNAYTQIPWPSLGQPGMKEERALLE